jgi:hypothetical protein
MGNVTKQKRKRWITPILIAVSLIALCNLPGPSDFFELWVDYNHYKYSNGDGTLKFTENLFKNDRFHFTRTITWPEFFKKYPNGDTTIYRNFTKNPLAFWRFGKYFFDRRYTLPYMSRKQAVENGRLKRAKGILPNETN